MVEAHKENVPVSICGELAADPAGALLLMAMGYNFLSMNANNLPKIKAVIRSSRFDEVKVMLRNVLNLNDSEHIRQELEHSLNEMGLGAYA